MCSKFSEGGEEEGEQHLQWADPPDWLDLTKKVKNHHKAFLDVFYFFELLEYGYAIVIQFVV